MARVHRNAAFAAVLAIAAAGSMGVAQADQAPERYVVKKGDSCKSIAREHDISLTALVVANKLANPDTVRFGQVLIIPSSERARVPPSETEPAASVPAAVITKSSSSSGLGALAALCGLFLAVVAIVAIVRAVTDALARARIRKHRFQSRDVGWTRKLAYNHLASTGDVEGAIRAAQERADAAASHDAETARALAEEQAEEAALEAALGEDVSEDLEHYVIAEDGYERDTQEEALYRTKYRAKMLKVFGIDCSNCGCDDNGMEIDHFLFPKSKGGNFRMRHMRGHYVNNAIPLCRTCNGRKSAKQARDFFSHEKLLELLRKNAEMTRILNARAPLESGVQSTDQATFKAVPLRLVGK